MRRFLAAVLFGLGAVVLVALPASAAGPFGLSLSGAVIPFVSGDVSQGGTLKYDDVFENGWGGRLEAYYDFTPSLRAQIGGTYQEWGGKTVFDVFEIDDLKMWALYVGAKYRFLPKSRFRPYVVADVGYASLDSVDLTRLEPILDGAGNVLVPAGTRVPYWDKTNTYFADAGAGLEFMATPNLGIYLDVRAQLFGAPDELLTPVAKADDAVALPVSLGVNYNF